MLEAGWMVNRDVRDDDRVYNGPDTRRRQAAAIALALVTRWPYGVPVHPQMARFPIRRPSGRLIAMTTPEF